MNLEQIVESIVSKREEPDFLRQQLLAQPHDEDDIRYRQELFSDLEDPSLLASAKRFADALSTARRHIVQTHNMRHRLEQEGWLLEAGAIYAAAVTAFADDLGSRELRSRALKQFSQYLDNYVRSAPFRGFEEETRACKAALSNIVYTTRISAGRVDVARSEDESDYSAEVESVFERFRQGAAKDYLIKFRGWPGVDRVGAQILDLVARLFVDEFAMLEQYAQRHRSFFDRTIRDCERELDFYLAYRDYIDPMSDVGLSFCLPSVSSSKAVRAVSTFDVALAAKAVADGLGPVITNDLELSGVERIFVISGPNQGGKTTFARTFGQIHHLASIGCPVPGTEADLFLFDQIFTHFEREEDLVRMSGKLEDDLVRIHEILERATPSSLLILNEIFTSTALKDARYLGTKIMERVIALDLLCVYVTFVDEIATMGETVVSMMSTVVPENPAERTFKVVRAPANGLAYATALAEKHGLTYQRIKERMSK